MAVVMAANQVARTIARMAHEIVERHHALEELALIGVRTRGVPIARRLSSVLADITGVTVPTGVLDITLYRDDLMRQPVGPSRFSGGRRLIFRSTTAASCSLMTFSTLVGRCERRLML